MSDRLSDLPDCVLLYIIKFLNLKQAVRTCVLSKRWKHLWKCLTILTFDSKDFRSSSFFHKFVYSVLSRRDDPISLHNLDLSSHYGDTKLVNRIMTYGASHDIQQLSINVHLNYHHHKDFELPSCLFSCRSLTFLNLSFWYTRNEIKLPKSLELPALKSLHIKHVTFATSDNGGAEPFSRCNMLSTLVMQDCYLQSDAKVLCVSNSKLFSLTIINLGKEAYEINLSTPNLNLLAIIGYPVHQLSSACNITCLEEVNIRLFCIENDYSLVLFSWLQVLISVKILTLSSMTLVMFNDLLSRGSFRTQLPSFVRLTSLKLMEPFISDEEISRMVEDLLQNSPLTKVDIIKC